MKKIILLIALFFALQANSFAQGNQNVNINLVIAPPYSTSINTYANNPGKVIVTLTYTPPPLIGGSTRVFLKASIMGDNGITLSTKPNYVPSQPIILDANVPYVLDVQKVTELFDINSLNVQGITTREVIAKGGFPEGNYQFCVRAYMYDNPNVPASAASPSGCTNVRLTQLEPPILVNPFNNENIEKYSFQNIIFNWNIPAGAEPGTQYVLRIIEMLDPNKNPNDAMNSKTVPAFFETTTSSNIFLYGSAQPALVDGRKYAWSVTALPGPTGSAYKNNGRSEIRSFTYTFKKSNIKLPSATTDTLAITTSLPKNNEKVEPDFVNFKWDYADGKTIVNEELVLVEINDLQKAGAAIASNNRISSIAYSNKAANVNLRTYEGKKMAWMVKVTDNKGKIYTSDVQVFDIKVKPKPSITHLYPKNGESVPSAKTTFHWTYNNAFDKIKDKHGNIKDNYPDQQPIIVEIKAGQTPAEAIKKNTNINTAGTQNINTKSIDLSAYAGKKLAWKVNLEYLGKTYSSNIDTFTVIQFNQNLKNNITEFAMNGFPVKVSTLTNIEGFNYAGTGTTTLYKDGPMVKVSFDNLTILPFGVKFKGNTKEVEAYTNWEATLATQTVKTSPYYSLLPLSIPLKPSEKNIGGNSSFEVSTINFNPLIVSNFDANKQCFVKLNYAQNSNNFDFAPTITGKFKWKSPISGKINGVTKMAEFYSNAEETFVYSYQDKFQLQSKSYPLYLNGVTTSNSFINLKPNEELTIGTNIKMTGGLNVEYSISGSYKVNSPKNNKKGIEVSFLNMNTLEFDKTLDGEGWKEYLDDNKGFVKATIKKVSVCLNSNANKPLGITIPELKVSLHQFAFTDESIADYTLKCIEFSGINGLKFNVEQNYTKPIKFNYSGFDVSSNKIKIIVDKTVLGEFTLASTLKIPFINRDASFNLSANNAGFTSSSLQFSTAYTTPFFNDINSGDKASYNPTKAKLEQNYIYISGDLSWVNTKDPEKNINISKITIPDIKVNSDGVASLPSVDMEGYAQTITQPIGVFNGFKLTPMKIKLDRDAGDNYNLGIKGMLVLADNLTSNNNTENFTTSVYFKMSKVEKTGNSLTSKNFKTFAEYHQYKKELNDQAITYTSKAFAGSDNEVSSFTNAGLVYFSNDKDYGSGFKASLNYNLKNPADPGGNIGSNQSVSAILWIGHMKEKGGYNYWFMEAGQKNFVVMPTGILDITINGFKGRVFYHMRHDGNDLNDNTTYKPDNSKFLGLFSQVNIKTASDNGIKFWGDLAMEILTGNSGLESIRLLGNGNFITLGEGTEGIINAKDCSLDMYWNPKKILGNFNTTFLVPPGAMMQIKANAGFEISGSTFHLWGKASSGDLFGITSQSEVGFDLDDKKVQVYGNYKLVDIHWHRDGVFSDDDIYIKIAAGVNASLTYSPFHVQASADFIGSAIYTEETLGSLSMNISAKGQFEMPNPTCVSAGVSLFGFDITLGVNKDGVIWHHCW